MKLEGKQIVAASRQAVWEALNDPEVLRQCIPGCQSLTREADDRFAAVAEVKIGPIGARFKGNVSLSEIDAPNGYVISGSGNGGIAGNAKGRAQVRLSDEGAGTMVSYVVEAEVGGRMAQLGGPIIDATARQLAGRFFAQFGAVVTGGVAAGAPAAMPAAGAAPAIAVRASTSPWPWLALSCVALVAGYLLGQSDAAYGWVAGTAALAGMAFLAGRRS